MKIRLYKKGLLEQKFRKNSKAKLKYKVGLMSYREMELLNNFDARKTGQWYWLSFPTFFSYFARVW